LQTIQQHPEDFHAKSVTQKIIFHVVQIAAGSRILCDQNIRRSLVPSVVNAARLLRLRINGLQ
jgi:hypothetical protein